LRYENNSYKLPAQFTQKRGIISMLKQPLRALALAAAGMGISDAAQADTELTGKDMPHLITEFHGRTPGITSSNLLAIDGSRVQVKGCNLRVGGNTGHYTTLMAVGPDGHTCCKTDVIGNPSAEDITRADRFIHIRHDEPLWSSFVRAGILNGGSQRISEVKNPSCEQSREDSRPSTEPGGGGTGGCQGGCTGDSPNGDLGGDTPGGGTTGPGGGNSGPGANFN
jgi:hypothetical protein